MLPGADECMLEWDGEGKAPVPLLKEMFASERRKAKVLNFSIAYGKTAHGLGKDWKVSLEEAQNTVNRWYADRPEVSATSYAIGNAIALTAAACYVHVTTCMLLHAMIMRVVAATGHHQVKL